MSDTTNGANHNGETKPVPTIDINSKGEQKILVSRVGSHSIALRKWLKWLGSVVTLAAATLALWDALGKIPQLTLSVIGQWLTTEFTMVSTGVVIALFGALVTVLWLREINKRDYQRHIAELNERTEELTDEFHRGHSRLEFEIKSLNSELENKDIALRDLTEQTESLRNNASHLQYLNDFTLVHGVLRHTFFKSVHDLPISKLTNPDAHEVVILNVCCTTLAEIEKLLQQMLGEENVLCCTKIRRDDSFLCIYPLLKEDDHLLHAVYGEADGDNSLPGRILKDGRESYWSDLNELPFELLEDERSLFQRFDISGFIACPIRIVVEISSIQYEGVFFAFLRHGTVPRNEEIFRLFCRLYAEQITDYVQFSRSMVRKKGRQNVSESVE